MALLIDSGQLSDADAALDALDAEDPDGPETLRLVAHLRLLQNHRCEALAAAL